MPLITLRWHFQRPPRPTFFGRCGSSRAHSLSERSPRPTPAGTIRSLASHTTRRTGSSHPLGDGPAAAMLVVGRRSAAPAQPRCRSASASSRWEWPSQEEMVVLPGREDKARAKGTVPGSSRCHGGSLAEHRARPAPHPGREGQDRRPPPQAGAGSGAGSLPHSRNRDRNRTPACGRTQTVLLQAGGMATAPAGGRGPGRGAKVGRGVGHGGWVRGRGRAGCRCRQLARARPGGGCRRPTGWLHSRLTVLARHLRRGEKEHLLPEPAPPVRPVGRGVGRRPGPGVAANVTEVEPEPRLVNEARPTVTIPQGGFGLLGSAESVGRWGLAHAGPPQVRGLSIWSRRGGRTFVWTQSAASEGMDGVAHGAGRADVGLARRQRSRACPAPGDWRCTPGPGSRWDGPGAVGGGRLGPATARGGGNGPGPPRPECGRGGPEERKRGRTGRRGLAAGLRRASFPRGTAAGSV